MMFDHEKEVDYAWLPICDRLTCPIAPHGTTGAPYEPDEVAPDNFVPGSAYYPNAWCEATQLSISLSDEH